MRIITVFALFILTSCGGISLRHEYNVKKYIEKRACAQAQGWLSAQNYNVVGISCAPVKVRYIEYRVFNCGSEEPNYLGCFEADEEEDKFGATTVSYDITIATQNWGWENTLVHEYCHFLLFYAGYADWVDACHTTVTEPES